MPEGDTIHRTAIRLRPALEGHGLTRFEARRLVGARPGVGETIESVEARGKHLLIRFGGGLTLRTHMKMTGAWHLYRAGERWAKGAHLARAVVGADSGWVAVCFQAPVVETFHERAPTPDALAALGPDLAGEDPDLDAVVGRFVRLVAADTGIADALLDQRIAAGLGNVYKSDVLFLHGLHPRTPAPAVDAGRLRAIYRTAHQLPVYGRQGRPCPRCGAVVRMRRRGDLARSTYWCPACQPAGDAVAVAESRE